MSDRETQPPDAPDAEAVEFEAAISERGESSARLEHVLALFEQQAGVRP